MCTYDEEMILTNKISNTEELISLEDYLVAENMWILLERAGWRTYEFNIASDTLTDSEETA